MEIRYRLEKRDILSYCFFSVLCSRAFWAVVGVTFLLVEISGFAGRWAVVPMNGNMASQMGSAVLQDTVYLCISVGMAVLIITSALYFAVKKMMGEWRILLLEQMAVLECSCCTRFISYGRLSEGKRWGGLLILREEMIGNILLPVRFFKNPEEKEVFLSLLSERIKTAQKNKPLEIPQGESRPWFSFWFYTNPVHAAAVQKEATELAGKIEWIRKRQKQDLRPVGVLFGLWAAYYFAYGIWTGNAAKLISALLILAMVFLGMRWGWRHPERVSVKIQEKKTEKVVGTYRLQFYEDAYMMEQKEWAAAVLWPYHSLKNVISTKDKFFFFQSDGTFLFLPKAIFQSEEEIEAFSRFLRSRGVEFQENMTAESVR